MAKTLDQLQREYRQRRRARGLCGWSGCKLVTRNGRFYCHSHSEHHNAKRRARKVNALRVAA